MEDLEARYFEFMEENFNYIKELFHMKYYMDSSRFEIIFDSLQMYDFINRGTSNVFNENGNSAILSYMLTFFNKHIIDEEGNRLSDIYEAKKDNIDYVEYIDNLARSAVFLSKMLDRT